MGSYPHIPASPYNFYSMHVSMLCIQLAHRLALGMFFKSVSDFFIKYGVRSQSTSGMDVCLHCEKTIRPSNQAVSCQLCGSWQHRGCDTGTFFFVMISLKNGSIWFLVLILIL